MIHVLFYCRTKFSASAIKPHKRTAYQFVCGVVCFPAAVLKQTAVKMAIDKNLFIVYVILC